MPRIGSVSPSDTSSPSKSRFIDPAGGATRQRARPRSQACVDPFYAHVANQTGEDILEVRQDIFGAAMNEKIASHLKCKAGTIATCAFRRYITSKGTLIA